MPRRVTSVVGFSLSFSLCAAVSAVTMACGRPETAADRQLAEMREQVSRMQADEKADQRLGSLDAVGDDESPRPRMVPVEAPAASSGGSAPGLPVRGGQLGGPSDEDVADPNEPGARPDIRLTGPGGASRAPERSRSGRNGRARVEESDPRSPSLRTDGTRSSALDPDAKKAYEAALAQVQSKQYDRGLEGLTAFLVRWPDHPYAENALYWRGEAYFAQGEFLRAAEQFDAVLTRSGSGNKGPDALLKLGMCHERLGASQRAREYWDRLKNEYPRSDTAKRIPASSREPSPKGPKENR
jgi:tol-pal system protein YbgF